jgi:hypothetical protein
MALAISFGRAHPLVAGAFKANLISMLAVLAWLYTATPVRLCNSYLKGDQERLGLAMAFLAVALAITWGTGLMFGSRRTSSASNVPGYRSERRLGDLARPMKTPCGARPASFQAPLTPTASTRRGSRL